LINWNDDVVIFLSINDSDLIRKIIRRLDLVGFKVNTKKTFVQEPEEPLLLCEVITDNPTYRDHFYANVLLNCIVDLHPTIGFYALRGMAGSFLLYGYSNLWMNLMNLVDIPDQLLNADLPFGLNYTGKLFNQSCFNLLNDYAKKILYFECLFPNSYANCFSEKKEFLTLSMPSLSNIIEDLTIKCKNPLKIKTRNLKLKDHLNRLSSFVMTDSTFPLLWMHILYSNNHIMIFDELFSRNPLCYHKDSYSKPSFSFLRLPSKKTKYFNEFDLEKFLNHLTFSYESFDVLYEFLPEIKNFFGNKFYINFDNIKNICSLINPSYDEEFFLSFISVEINISSTTLNEYGLGRPLPSTISEFNKLRRGVFPPSASPFIRKRLQIAIEKQEKKYILYRQMRLHLITLERLIEREIISISLLKPVSIIQSLVINDTKQNSLSKTDEPELTDISLKAKFLLSLKYEVLTQVKTMTNATDRDVLMLLPEILKLPDLKRIKALIRLKKIAKTISASRKKTINRYIIKNIKEIIISHRDDIDGLILKFESKFHKEIHQEFQLVEVERKIVNYTPLSILDSYIEEHPSRQIDITDTLLEEDEYNKDEELTLTFEPDIDFSSLPEDLSGLTSYCYCFLDGDIKYIWDFKFPIYITLIIQEYCELDFFHFEDQQVYTFTPFVDTVLENLTLNVIENFCDQHGSSLEEFIESIELLSQYNDQVSRQISYIEELKRSVHNSPIEFAENQNRLTEANEDLLTMSNQCLFNRFLDSEIDVFIIITTINENLNPVQEVIDYGEDEVREELDLDF